MAGSRWRRRRTADADPGGGSVAPHVLELRIHGVNNTAPPAMLDLPPAGVEQVAGDALGSFWRPVDGGTDRLSPDDPGRVPPGIVREAYSWGGLARTSPGLGAGALGVAVGALGRVGWTLLVPFGLVNAAFWSRPLNADGASRTWQQGRHARSLRVFAVALTLLLVGSTCIVGLDLVASQCFVDAQRVCRALPSALEGLAAEPRGARLALLTAVPIGVLLLVAGLASLSRTRYEQLSAMPAAGADIAPTLGATDDIAPTLGATDGTPPTLGATDHTTPTRGAPDDDPWHGPRPPALLATPGFWSNARLTATQARVHLAAGLAFVVLSSCWYAVVRAGDACFGPDGQDVDGGLRCLTSFAVPDGVWWWFGVTGGIAVVVLLVLLVTLLDDRAWAQVGAPVDDADRPAPPLVRRVTRVLWVTFALVAAHLLLLALAPPEGEGPAHPAGPEASLLLLVVALLALALRALRWCRPRRVPRAQQMWSGRAPGVFLLLALGIAFALSTLVVVGAGDWLNGDRSAGDLVRQLEVTPAEAAVTPAQEGSPQSAEPTAQDDQPVAQEDADPPGPHLQIPAFLVWFGLALGPGLLVVGAVAGWSASRVSPDLPAALGSPEDVAADTPVAWGSAQEIARRTGADRARRSARRAAGVAHRAEPVLGVLAAVLGVCAAAAVVLTVLSWARVDAWPDPWAGAVLREGSDGLWADLVDVAAWGAGAAALLVVAGLVGGSLTGGHRPLGLLWDLLCFLPRAGHPFGPPCYAERVVPELVRRVHDWLRADPRHRVVLSAHSLGAVLAVASLLAARVELGARALERVALLTYGTQLRPYFGRIFPELIGPDVLGTTPGRGAAAGSPDPWAALVAADLAAPPSPVPPRHSLRDLLASGGRLRWVSLWRRTDYLGFPVDRYVGGPVDRPAEEIDASGYLPTVGTHGGYTKVGAYRRALEDLVR